MNRQYWGLAVDVSNFYGQEKNIATLTDLIREKHCRLILLLGMGGTGKTFLSVKIAQLMEDEFDFIIWRSLKVVQDVRSLKTPISSGEMIDNWLSFFSQEKRTNCSLQELIDCLRSHKCLLILDSLESILESKNHHGKYQENYQSYRQLLDILGMTSHRSCVIITSREKPENFNLLQSRGKKICCLSIKGEGYHLINLYNQLIYKSSQLINKQHYLCRYYDNNYILLQIVITYINKLFQRQLDNFIEQEVRLFREIDVFLDEHFERLSPLETIIIKSFNTEDNHLDHKLISKKKTVVFLV